MTHSDGDDGLARVGTVRSAIGVSGKGRNDPDGPIYPTEGPVLLIRVIVTHLTRYTASRYDELLVTK